MTCIIIDDEPLARKGLKEYIREVDFLELVGDFDNPLKASDILLSKQIDLIFIDIQMPKITGLDFIKTLLHPPQFIFTTAYPQYALEGFELNAIDYLLKPFSFERFLKAVNKAKLHVENGKRIPADTQKTDHFFIKTDSRLVKIKYDDILFVEALQNYVCIVTTEKKYITYLTFKAIEENLSQDQFLKIHKSFIVSISKIESIEGNEIRIGNHSLPISRSSKEDVMEKILHNRFLKRN